MQYDSRNIRDFYAFDQQNAVIGEGSYAKVIYGQSLMDGRDVAIKIIQRQKMDQQQQLLLDRQMYIMKHISHPNIVDFYDCFQDKDRVYIVLEYLNGGDLYSQIQNISLYTEQAARQILIPIVDAVRYLHQLGVVHRDLKPQNLVYSSRNPGRVIKIIDFGVSQIISNQNPKLSTAIGTPLYMAPQILAKHKYDQQVDWWSVGIIMYVLLCGYPPYSADTQSLLLKQINKGLQFDEQDWGLVSSQAKDLVSKLLDPHSQSRIRVDQIINHDWIVGNYGNINKQLTQVKNNLKKKHKFKRIVNMIRSVIRLKKAVGNPKTE